MIEIPESPKSPHKLVLPENISISTFYTVHLGEIGPKVAKLVNLAQDLEAPNKAHNSPTGYVRGPESPKSPHKLVLPENISISAFYTVQLGEIGPKVA